MNTGNMSRIDATTASLERPLFCGDYFLVPPDGSYIRIIVNIKREIQRRKIREFNEKYGE